MFFNRLKQELTAERVARDHAQSTIAVLEERLAQARAEQAGLEHDLDVSRSRIAVGVGVFSNLSSFG